MKQEITGHVIIWKNREYYQEHQVWNKGLSWSPEVRERIRQGYLK
jgi:hypothetical protein